MGPVLDFKERKETAMEASTSKGHTAFVSMEKDKNMKPESKHKGKFHMGSSLNEQDVDVSKSKNDNDAGQPQSGDSTASSSSFSNAFSDVGDFELESDNEVMSDFRGDMLPVRKKKVTSHWKKFVQPIMWRCKWVELQLKKFQSMAIMYDKEIEKHNQTKRLKYKNFELEGGCAKSIPFFHDSQREKPMKRKIRKRHEEWDPEVYMSQHNLFSYFATCRSPAQGPTMDDDQTNLGSSSPKNVGNGFRVPDELLSLEFRDDYSLEQVLWKIEVSKSQVSEMKNKLNAIMTENSERILSTEDLVLHESSNALTSPVKEPDYPTNMEGPSVVASFASQLIKLNTGDDLVKPDDLVKDENAAFEETHPQDANKPIDQPPVYSRKRSTDGILIYNRRAKKQIDSGDVKIHPVEVLQAPVDEKSNTAPVSEDLSQNEQPAQKILSVSKLNTPRNTKKRAARTRRNNGSSLWTRKASG
ncbi:hypothetical protein M8C21_018842 [Ambrosia artemisiifolia]|uniref:Uncharacterized protein n=1 Tax=Ambrosia artemisiifolia TaxID=4212 RepID=A0AAD5BN15_AMBAR|nr:hypothetical protein M8C21_018842 [Ambrosia artemisiifolia]